MPARVFESGVDPLRAELIRVIEKKWVNGSVIQYGFIGGGTPVEKDVVRKAFAAWKNVGIGLEFREVDGPSDHIRIGFVRGHGAWSYIGRDILDFEHNMNFGWNIAEDLDTAIHEIGHALGFPHEHQNPNAGIVWNEEAVYADLAAPPNNWDRAKTFYNIIRKLPVSEVRGSGWDPDSIMHYPFGPGLIVQPAQYQNGLQPAGGLSAQDAQFAKTFYPPLTKNDTQALKPFESVRITIEPGQQVNFVITPTRTRNYTMQTIGSADTLLVLFEEVPGGDPVYLSGDDDSGTDRNARIVHKLQKDRKYILRARLYYVERRGECGVLLS